MCPENFIHFQTDAVRLSPTAIKVDRSDVEIAARNSLRGSDYSQSPYKSLHVLSFFLRESICRVSERIFAYYGWVTFA